MDDFDRAKIYAIHDFAEKNLHVVRTKLIATNPLHTIKCRSGSAISLALVKKALFETLPIAGDYRIGLILHIPDSPWLGFYHDGSGKKCFLGNGETSSEMPVTFPEHSETSEEFVDWYRPTQHYTKAEILDALVREFPLTNFSFLGR